MPQIDTSRPALFRILAGIIAAGDRRIPAAAVQDSTSVSAAEAILFEERLRARGVVIEDKSRFSADTVGGILDDLEFASR